MGRIAAKSCCYRKPRTTDLRSWLWGAALKGRSEHSLRAYAWGVLGYGINRQLTISVLTNPGSTCRQFLPHQPSIVSGLIIFVGSGLTWMISQPYPNPLSKAVLQLYSPREYSIFKMKSVSPSTFPDPFWTAPDHFPATDTRRGTREIDKPCLVGLEYGLL